MAEQAYHIEIITPGKVLFSDDVDTVEAPGEMGEFQVYPEHTPFLSGLATGSVILSREGKKTFVSISGGFCEVQPEKTVILAQTAEMANDIDVARAQAAKTRAEERLEAPVKEDVDEERAKAALARALNRLNTADMLKQA